MSSTADLRRLLITGTAAERRAAWTLVQRTPRLDRDFQRLLVESGQLRYGQHLEFVTIAGYEFEQVTYPDGGREIRLGEFEIDYCSEGQDPEQLLQSKIRAAGFSGTGRQRESIRDLTAARFPFNKTGQHKSRLALINPRNMDESRQCFRLLTEQLGRSDGDLAEGLEVLRLYPSINLWILMYGTSGLDRWELASVPAFNASGLQRLDLYDANANLGRGYEGWALVAG